MKSPFVILSRIKKFELDEKKRQLSAELEQEEIHIKKLKNLNEDYEREKKIAALHPELCDFGLYTEQYLKKKRTLEHQIKKIRERIDLLRDEMATIYKDQKTYDIVEQTHQMEAQKAMETQEQKMLDEIGTNAYIKKKQD